MVHEPKTYITSLPLPLLTIHIHNQYSYIKIILKISTFTLITIVNFELVIIIQINV